jgi:hypothetical protein
MSSDSDMSDTPTDMHQSVKGQCLCGEVKFSLTGPLRGVSVCHCGQCRRWHGHLGAYTNVRREALSFSQNSTLTWYLSSDQARRGFCRDCGSVLFWDAPLRDTISITAGCLDRPTGLMIDVQIFTEDKGDYYALDPSIPIRPKAT